MSKTIVTTFLVLYSTFLFSQQKTLLSYDVLTKNIDSIPYLFDETITAEKTEHFIGQFDNKLTDLDLEVPTSNLWENATFTRKQKASDRFDLSSYPLRTTIKTFLVDGDSLIGNCSGSMISTKHVLLAMHCLTDLINDTLASFDSIYVCPIYNNGMRDVCFDCVEVEKVFYFKNWGLPAHDIAVLELNTEIGNSTGWLGIGFNNDDAFFNDKVFYKFSYPGITVLPIDPNEYNGDTLYFSYGLLDITIPTTLGINNVNGIPGESGSSIIHIDADKSFTSYGALSLGFDLRHCRLNNWIYFAFKEIIKNDLSMSMESNSIDNISLFPNPTLGTFEVKGITNQEVIKLMIHDNSGRLVRPLQEVESCDQIDISNFANGVYHVSIFIDDLVKTKSIILTR